MHRLKYIRNCIPLRSLEKVIIENHLLSALDVNKHGKTIAHTHTRERASCFVYEINSTELWEFNLFSYILIASLQQHTKPKWKTNTKGFTKKKVKQTKIMWNKRENECVCLYWNEWKINNHATTSYFDIYLLKCISPPAIWFVLFSFPRCANKYSFWYSSFVFVFSFCNNLTK